MAIALNRRGALCILLALLVFFLLSIDFSGSKESLLQAAITTRTRLAETIGRKPDETTSNGKENEPSLVNNESDDHLPPTPISPAKENANYCKWQFSHYEPSAYESEWKADIRNRQKRVCETMMEAQHREYSRQIVQRVLDQMAIGEDIRWRTVDSLLPSELPSEFELFSRMHYSRSCYDEQTNTYKPSSGSGIQLIEPLWGMLRDPFDIHCNYTRLTEPDLEMQKHSTSQRLNDSLLKGWNYGSGLGQSKQHILPQGYAPYMYDEDAEAPERGTANLLSTMSPWRSHGVPPWYSSLIPRRDPRIGQIYTTPRNVHIDIGSSYFGGWDHLAEDPADPDWHPDISAASSGKWFYEHYHARGQPFDEFIAVELEPLNTTRVFRGLPKDLVGKYTFMNLGLTMDKDDQLNAIDLIKRLVRPEDFLVLKLDIDSAPIELPIVNSLLHDDPKHGGASALVDELMFEHRKSWPVPCKT